uniref:Malectin-like domain-containing protein n=1 Tax=Arundo donax TaxID=35708 RepID=A0A0A9FFH1_ARUDO
MPLQNDSYYVALYFADTLPENSRTFDVYINDYLFYKGLNVTSAGLSVFATQWILSGLTRVILTSASPSALPPLVNAGEVFGLFPLGRLTLARDALALESLKKKLQNVPEDWNGDPCMPSGYSWTGVTCDEGPRIRVVSLNFSSMGLSGSLSPEIAKLTALTEISFANNSLSGPIPNLSNLSRLQRLHLQDNKLFGSVPQTLGTLNALRELFLQNNELFGSVPENLLNKQGLTYKFLPGNHFFPKPPG